MENKDVRSAEHDRISSCPFADNVASISIQTFRENCPSELLSSLRQTVLAAFLVQDGNSTCPKAVAFGIGTKFLTRIKAFSSDGTYIRVGDCHAEILAKRAFRKYLLDQLNILTGKYGTSILEFSDPIDMRAQLRANVTIHFYSSSQPCGNASIKRWAKSSKPKQYTLSSYDYPSEMHSRFHVTARDQGQVSLLLKKDSLNNVIASSIPSWNTQTVNTLILPKCISSTIVLSSMAKITDDYIPPGITTIHSKGGSHLTCSDKIAFWNTLGIQGGILINILKPIYISTITNGRKFSEIHSQRAFCCRVQDFKYVTESNIFCTHHPTMLGTSVKFDTSIIHTSGEDAGASFAEYRSLSWCEGDVSAEVIDGSTGLLWEDCRVETYNVICSIIDTIEIFECDVQYCTESKFHIHSNDNERMGSKYNHKRIKTNDISIQNSIQILYHNAVQTSYDVKNRNTPKRTAASIKSYGNIPSDYDYLIPSISRYSFIRYYIATVRSLLIFYGNNYNDDNNNNSSNSNKNNTVVETIQNNMDSILLYWKEISDLKVDNNNNNNYDTIKSMMGYSNIYYNAKSSLLANKKYF